MDKKEFAHIYNETFPILFKVAVRIVGAEDAAEDVCQDALFRLHEKNISFPSPNEAKYWLIRVVKNASLNYAKRKGREARAYARAFHEGRQDFPGGEEAVLRKEAAEEVNAALEKLPWNLRIVLILKEYSELNYKEIGRVLGISEGNVKIRVFRAREKLVKILEVAKCALKKS
jgi:RNA polymerase sigma-70 factor (ECF subfamily)